MIKNNSEKNILDHREYIIKSEENEYNLRIEIDEEYLHFILSMRNKIIENVYKNKMDLITIVNKLELNSAKYSNLELILKIFDSIYEKNKILVNINEDNSCTLLFRVINLFEEEVVKEIKLYKEYMNNDDKFNVLYNKIKLLNNGDNKIEENKDNKENKEMKNIKNKLNEMDINMNKIQEEIKDELNKKDIAIKEMNKKILNLENELQKLNNTNNANNINNLNLDEIMNKKLEVLEKKLINDFNQKQDNIKSSIINELKKSNGSIQNIQDNKMENSKIKKNEEKYDEIIENIELTKKLKKEIEEMKKGNNLKKEENNKLVNNYTDKTNSLKEIELIKSEIKKLKNNDKEINKIENIIKEKEIIINKIIEKLNNQKNIVKVNSSKDKLDKKINDIINLIDEKYNELNAKINNYEYINKKNYIFKKEPQNLKYKLDINNSNTSAGWNDMFEIYISYKDNKEYLVSPNINNYNLEIYELSDNKKISSLKGHKNNVRTIRYFINKNSIICNEYFISGDDNKIVIIWDITDNFNIIYQIDTKYEHNIYSCLLVFPHNLNDNYIITSSYNESDNKDNSATKVYSLNNEKFIKYIGDTNDKAIYYLLSWYNKKNNKYYIIQFSFKKILINNIIENEIYSELIQEPEDNHFSGFLYNKDNDDYLCSSSSLGYINIWNLYNKKLIKNINIKNSKLAHIIQWNNKFIIVADYNNKSFKIVDLEEKKVISDISGQHTDKVVSVKKIYHPIFGESLLSTGRDKTIKLWTI